MPDDATGAVDVTEIFLLMLDDEPPEVLSAHSTRERAEAARTTYLEREGGKHDAYYWHWLNNRLNIRTVPLDPESPRAYGK